MKKMLVVLLVLIIALAGCKQSEDTKKLENPYIGGSNGVIAKFEVMGSPDPNGEYVYEGEHFPVIVTIKNKGEYEIPVGSLAVKLKGVNVADHFDNLVELKTNADSPIEGISEYNPNGGELELNFNDGGDDPIYTLQLLTGQSHQSVNFIGDVIYDYQTTAVVPEVCFNPDRRDTSVCTVDSVKTVYSSGAPIQITSVTEASAGTSRILLEFTVQNKGIGKVQVPGEEFDLTRDYVKFQMLNDEQGFWECTASGSSDKARLDNDQVIIRCRSDEIPAGSVYTGPVNLQLDYAYMTSISKSLTIRNADS